MHKGRTGHQSQEERGDTASKAQHFAADGSGAREMPLATARPGCWAMRVLPI